MRSPNKTKGSKKSLSSSKKGKIMNKATLKNFGAAGATLAISAFLFSGVFQMLASSGNNVTRLDPVVVTASRADAAAARAEMAAERAASAAVTAAVTSREPS
jgi:hypothetical protein